MGTGGASVAPHDYDTPSNFDLTTHKSCVSRYHNPKSIRKITIQNFPYKYADTPTPATKLQKKIFEAFLA